LIRRHFDGDLSGKTIALWGLAFKPNTDDMREAPSRVLMEALWRDGAKVRAFDPEARTETARLYPAQGNLTLCDSADAALESADALAVVTEWKAFRSPDFAHIKSTLRTPVLFDGRNLYDPDTVEAAGIAYYGIGRGRSVQRV
jgi:UDPglucose 6-dehydrogenase